MFEGREDEAKEENKGKKKKNKNVAKVKEFSKQTEIRVLKQKRCGKKMVTTMHGIDGFGINLKDFTKKLGKKFACGNAVVKEEGTEELIAQFLGDIFEDDLMMALKAEFPQMLKAKFNFIEGGNKKGRKKK